MSGTTLKKEEKRDAPFETGLKTTTETSQVFLPVFFIILLSKRLLSNPFYSSECLRTIFEGGIPGTVTWAMIVQLICQESLPLFRFYFFPSKLYSNGLSCEEKFPKNFKDFDQLISKILLNLEETENVFLNQAKAVLDRDLTLINWRFRLKALHVTLQEKKQDFERIDQTVQCFWRMSTHIDDILCKLEKELPGPSLVENAFKYSPARMTMYDAMMKLSISQKDMLQQISNAILSINEAIECNPSDPVEQFTRILSLHMEVLRTIEMQTGSVEEKLNMVRTLQKYYTNMKKPLLCDSYY